MTSLKEGLYVNENRLLCVCNGAFFLCLDNVWKKADISDGEWVPISLESALKLSGGTLPEGYFKKGERAAISLASHSARLLESFQWDMGNLEPDEMKEKIASLKGDLKELEDFLDGR